MTGAEVIGWANDAGLALSRIATRCSTAASLSCSASVTRTRSSARRARCVRGRGDARCVCGIVGIDLAGLYRCSFESVETRVARRRAGRGWRMRREWLGSLKATLATKRILTGGPARSRRSTEWRSSSARPGPTIRRGDLHCYHCTWKTSASRRTLAASGNGSSGRRAPPQPYTESGVLATIALSRELAAKWQARSSERHDGIARHATLMRMHTQSEQSRYLIIVAQSRISSRWC